MKERENKERLAVAPVVGQASGTPVLGFGKVFVNEICPDFETGVVLAHRYGGIEFVKDALGQSVAPPDLDQADIVLHDLGPLLDQVVDVEVHERVDLLLGPLPVLGAEGVKREGLDIEPGAVRDDRPNVGGSFDVPVDAGQVAQVRPPPVAIHDDGNVPGEPVGLHAEFVLGIQGRFSHNTTLQGHGRF